MTPQRPLGVSEVTWATLTDHEQRCAAAVALEDLGVRGSPWPSWWTRAEILAARTVGRRVIDPRCGRR